MSRVLITPLADGELEPALALLFSDVAAEHRLVQVARAVKVFASGEVDPTHFLVARLSPRGPAVSAVFAQVLPGAVAMIWPPRTGDVLERELIEKTLLRTLLLRLRALGVKLVQSFLAVDDHEGAAVLARNGFHDMTRIWTMRCDQLPFSEATFSTQNLQFIAYPDCDPALFQQTLMQTYEASLDCPELNGLRTPEEVMAGFRRSAPDTSRWWLIIHEKQSVGVLILTDGSLEKTWDLGYLGIIPTARRKGYSRVALRFAMGLCAGSRIESLMLLVDARNEPALALYRSFGFKMVDLRQVFLLFGLQS